MNKKKIQYIMEEMIEELRECEDGTVTSTSELAQQLGYEDMDLFEVHNALVSSAKANKITLDFSAYDNEVVGLPYNIPFTVKNKKAQTKCPYCGSTDTARYIHGYPVFNERMKKKLDEGKWTLAGCLVNGVEINGKFVNTMPSMHCNTCDKDFGTPSLLITKKKELAEDYRDIVESIKFYVGGYFGGFTNVTIRKNKDGAIVKVMKTLDPDIPVERQITQKQWNKIVNTLYSQMYLHEWKKKYEDMFIDDGTQWNLEIHLTNNRVRNYYGSNAYPPYWNELEKIFKRYLKR